MAVTALHAINGFRDSNEGAAVMGDIESRHANGNAFLMAMGPAPLAAASTPVSRFNR